MSTRTITSRHPLDARASWSLLDRAQRADRAIAGWPRPAWTPYGYWEDRARRFAARGAGLGAVCSYGMPWFYNRYIQVLQHRALRPWLGVSPGTSVLEIGCGVGRWSRRLARAGATVTAIDLAPTMVSEARRRVNAARVGNRCRFLVADVAELALDTRFDRILGVTVLQHVLDPERFQASIQRLADHLNPAGRIILLEAAPTRPSARCDSPVFVARDERVYQQAFLRARLRCLAVGGVDPAPFKTWFLPWYGRLPKPLAMSALFAVTVAALPLDLAARRLTDASWHKLFVLARQDDA